MDLKQIAKDTAKTLISYLTYQAMRTVLAQLSETDPPRALWLQQFSARQNLQDGEAYLRALLAEHPELAYRIMTVREHIAAEVVDYLPEMAKSGIQQANMEHRRNHLERITSATGSLPVTHPEAGSPPQNPRPETE
ncbi:RuBisCO chaperone RbcX [Thermostichus sp. OS-CIW-31]